MCNESRTKLVFLFGCTEAVRAQVNFDKPWGRSVTGSVPQVFEFRRFDLGTWWSDKRYEKFFRSKPEYFLQLDEYLRTTIHAQMFAAGFDYYEGWEQDVVLVVIGEEYRPAHSPAVREIFRTVFPKGDFFPADRERILDSPLWGPDVGPPETVELADPIELLELPRRVYNVLRKEGIETVGQLVAMTANQLKHFDGIGEGALRDIVVALRRFELQLAG
jgi:hypothetical protein